MGNPKLMLINDPHKWSKKFVLLFNREKVIDMCSNPAQPFDIKNMGLKPTPLNKQGEKLLTQYPKFWILFVKLVSDRLKTTEAKRSLRDQVLSTLKVPEGHVDLELLTQEMQLILDL